MLETKHSTHFSHLRLLGHEIYLLISAWGFYLTSNLVRESFLGGEKQNHD